MITHPLQPGTKTNIGTIRSYKYVKFGISKYRYFIEGDDKGYPEDSITTIIK